MCSTKPAPKEEAALSTKGQASCGAPHSTDRVTTVLCNKLLLTLFGMFRCLPDLPWADGNLAELALLIE